MEEIFLLKRNSPSRVRDGVQELQGKASACQKGFAKIHLRAALCSLCNTILAPSENIFQNRFDTLMQFLVCLVHTRPGMLGDGEHVGKGRKSRMVVI